MFSKKAIWSKSKKEAACKNVTCYTNFRIKIYPADSEFSKGIRYRENWRCRRCGFQFEEGDPSLQCCHYHSRGMWSVRYDPRNAFAGCFGCHRYLDAHPYEMVHFMIKILGRKEHDSLLLDANRTCHKDMKLDLIKAKAYHEQMKKEYYERRAKYGW